MRIAEIQESRLVPYLHAFLNLPRQHYFQDQLIDNIASVLRESKGFSFDDAVYSLEDIGSNFFYKFRDFLRTQEISIDVEDVCDISDAFLEVFKGKQFNFDGQTFEFDDILDWEEFFEVILLESNTMHLGYGKAGYDAAVDLARTAVSNDLDPQNCQELIENFRSEVRGRISDIEGLPEELSQELQSRLEYYCDRVFPQSCLEFDQPDTFLGLLLTEVSDLAREGFVDMKSFLTRVGEFETVVLRIFSGYDSLIERHAAALAKKMQEITGKEVKPTLPELKKAIFKFGLENFISHQEAEKEEVSGVRINVFSGEKGVS